MRLEGKSAIVTGGARGIGEAVCLAFAREGADIMVTDVLPDEIGNISEEITAMGRRSMHMTVDVTDKSQVDQMVAKARETFGRIDILANVAGIFVQNPIEDVSEKDWDRVIAVNLKGTFLCGQAAGKVMIEQKGGSIVNIASIAGHMPQIGLGAYSPSKAAIVMLTRMMAVEWAGRGVRVNAISPGPTMTPMFKGIYKNEAQLNRRKKAIPMNRFADPSEIANAAVFLASEEAGFITGDSLIIDGGSANSMYHLMGMLPPA